MKSFVGLIMKWYKYDIRNLSRSEYDHWYSVMSEDRKRRVDRFRFAEDKKRTVAGEMLARRALAGWCGVQEESIVFGRNEHGKPFAVDLTAEYNVSHSGDMVVCAVADHPVGIDIEKIRLINLNIANYAFNDEELIYLFGHKPDAADFKQIPDEGMLIRFFELWTAKEAYVKCVGTGIVDLKSVCAPKQFVLSEKDYIISIFEAASK